MVQSLIGQYYLFNDGYILQLMSETNTVTRKINKVLDEYGGQMNDGQA